MIIGWYTNTLKPILIAEAFSVFIIDIPDPQKLIMKLTKYTIPMPAVAAKIPSLKFSVGAIIFVL